MIYVGTVLACAKHKGGLTLAQRAGAVLGHILRARRAAMVARGRVAQGLGHVSVENAAYETQTCGAVAARPKSKRAFEVALIPEAHACTHPLH